MIASEKPKRLKKAANRKNFTEHNVLRLPAKKAQYLIWDEGTGAARGLAILVSPTGTRSYRCAFYYPGSSKAHYKHLGRVGEMTLEEARRMTRDVRKAAAEGKNPKDDKPGRFDSVKTAIEAYIQDQQIARKANWSAKKTEAVMLKHTEEWHQRPVSSVTFDEVDTLLAHIRDGDQGEEGRPYMANRMHSHLRGFFNWCVRKKEIAASPMIDMERPFQNEKPRFREWFRKEAADKAIQALWRTADNLKQNDGRYLKMMIILGKRKEHLKAMRWEQIEDDWFWDAPPSRSPYKRLHAVPLPKLAQRVLGRHQGQGEVFTGVNLDRLERKIKKQSGVTDFIWHGLKHHAETKAAELRDKNGRSLILPHMRDLLFDHAPKRGAGAGYDHHDYKPEMRDAMEIWAGHIERLTTPEGVRKLR